MDRSETIVLNESDLREAVLFYLESFRNIKINPDPRISFSHQPETHAYSATIIHESTKKQLL